MPLIAIQARFREFTGERYVRKHYYHHSVFKACDEALTLRYAKRTPYEISKQFMKSRGEKEIHVYGETPLKLYDQMARRWGLKPEHRFVELGSGRGRGLFFLASFYDCRCHGIEWIHEFVQKGEGLHPNVHIHKDDFVTSSQLHGDFLYLYGTCLEDQDIMKLCIRFLMLSLECKIVTVSFALSEYHEAFSVEDSFEGFFPWGKGSLFLNKRREKACQKRL